MLLLIMGTIGMMLTSVISFMNLKSMWEKSQPIFKVIKSPLMIGIMCLVLFGLLYMTLQPIKIIYLAWFHPELPWINSSINQILQTGMINMIYRYLMIKTGQL